MEECIEIGRRIRELREKNNLTQSQLAKKLNTSRETIVKWENGERDIKTENTIKLANLFGVTCDYLLQGVESENVDINKRLGLSNSAIYVLEFFNHESDGTWLIPTINYLIEQETLSPMDCFPERFIKEAYPPDASEEYIEQQIDKYVALQNQWLSKNYVPVLSIIDDYLSIKPTNKIFKINKAGELEMKKSDGVVNEKLREVSYNSIVDKIMLSEIEDNLKWLKRMLIKFDFMLTTASTPNQLMGGRI